MTPKRMAETKMPFSDEGREEVVALLGTALIAVQNVELMIAKVLQYVLPEEHGTAPAEDIAAKLSKKTMGALIQALKKRADIDEGLVAALDDFLDRRNILAHRLRDIAGPKYERFDKLGTFAYELTVQASSIAPVFTDLLFTFSQNAGIQTSVDDLVRKSIGSGMLGQAGRFIKPKA